MLLELVGINTLLTGLIVEEQALKNLDHLWIFWAAMISQIVIFKLLSSQFPIYDSPFGLTFPTPAPHMYPLLVAAATEPRI
jgi:hypothetical protein